MAKNNEWLEVAAILTRKKKNENDPNEAPQFYMKVKKGVTVTLTEGDALQLQDPRARLDRLAASGHITEDEAAAKKARIPEYIKFDVVLPPARD